MNSRWKKVWADLWSNKSRTFLTVLTIAVGVLAVGFNSNLKLYMIESMDGDFLSARPAEATVYDWNPGAGREEPRVVWIVDRGLDI